MTHFIVRGFSIHFVLALCLTSVVLTNASTKIDNLNGIDIKLPDVRLINGVTLQRNGQGVRRISFFGMDINIYVAGLYSQSPLLSEEDVMSRCSRISSSTTGVISAFSSSSSSSLANDNENDPESNSNNCPLLQLDFTFLRSVNRGKVIMAWQRQLDYSVSYTYNGYENDRDDFVRMMSSGPIEYEGTQTVQLIGDETLIFDQGKYMGKITGHEFQKSFLSMWFGENPVAHDLKEGLLSGF